MLSRAPILRDHRTEDAQGFTLMTVPYLKQLCKEAKGYMSPALNNILYLHYKSFARIENLEQYTGVKSLWLEYNAIQVIEGLDNCSQLRCIYLNGNCIRHITGLSYLHHLNTLNLSENCIETLNPPDGSLDPGLAAATQLQTLILAKNRLRTKNDLQILSNLKNLTNLDLSKNQIDDVDALDVLVNLPELAILTFMGNPFVSKISPYRKTALSKLKSLTHLDERGVTERERKLVTAWTVGGIAGERVERKRWAERVATKHKEELQAFLQLQKQAAEKRGPGVKDKPQFSGKLQDLHEEMLARIDDEGTVVDDGDNPVMTDKEDGQSDVQLDGEIDLIGNARQKKRTISVSIDP